jgi:hypothetical protein
VERAGGCLLSPHYATVMRATLATLIRAMLAALACCAFRKRRDTLRFPALHVLLLLASGRVPGPSFSLTHHVALQQAQHFVVNPP